MNNHQYCNFFTRLFKCTKKSFSITVHDENYDLSSSHEIINNDKNNIGKILK